MGRKPCSAVRDVGGQGGSRGPTGLQEGHRVPLDSIPYLGHQFGQHKVHQGVLQQRACPTQVIGAMT